mgnify:CR=1 FL=1
MIYDIDETCILELDKMELCWLNKRYTLKHEGTEIEFDAIKSKILIEKM